MSDLAVLRCPQCHAVVDGPGTCAYCGAEIVRRSSPESEAESSGVAGWIEEARGLMSQGQKIAAIRLVRWHTGMGLKEAKDLVESGDLDDPVKAAKLPAGRDEPISEASCFPADARVATPTGEVAIASLRRGDAVLGWSGTRGLVRARVTRVIAHPAARVWRLRLRDGGDIATTAVHRFCTLRGWRRTSELGSGDAIVASDGSTRIVGAAEPTERVAVVYNLHTSGPHTFVVEGVVAHNFASFRALRTLWHRLVLDRRRVADELPARPAAAVARRRTAIGCRPCEPLFSSPRS